MVNISSNKNIIEIRYRTSIQEINKLRNSALIINPKLFQSDPNPSSPNTIKSTAVDDATVKSSSKRQLRYSVHAFNQTKLYIISFVSEVAPEMSNTVCQFLMKEDPSLWKIRQMWVKPIGDPTIVNSPLLPSPGKKNTGPRQINFNKQHESHNVKNNTISGILFL